MFSCEMLPAGCGDALWLTYGKSDALHYVLIDGGLACTARTIRARLRALPAERRRLDLLVVTHIDLDHIGGILDLLRRPPAGLRIDDVWFNAWDHLPQEEGILGAKQAESLSYQIEAHGYPWNAAFGGKAVALGPTDEGVPEIVLPGGMTLRLLGPSRTRLAELRRVWHAEIVKAGLVPGKAGSALERKAKTGDDLGVLGAPGQINIERLAAETFQEDHSAPNGSSIAFLAEYDGRRVLFAGDAFAGDLEAGLAHLGATAESPMPLSLFKLSHHGGRYNTSRALLERIRCGQYLVSTDGTRHGHPEPTAMARVISYGRRAGRPTLLFNYRSDQTNVWDDRALCAAARLGFVPEFPASGQAGLTVAVERAE